MLYIRRENSFPIKRWGSEIKQIIVILFIFIFSIMCVFYVHVVGDIKCFM